MITAKGPVKTSVGEGRYKVWLEKKELDRGLVYILGGGEKSHIGGVVLKRPGEELQIINVES